jgi:hypothetical protein
MEEEPVVAHRTGDSIVQEMVEEDRISYTDQGCDIWEGVHRRTTERTNPNRPGKAGKQNTCPRTSRGVEQSIEQV